MSEKDKKRSRTFNLVLYPEDAAHVPAIELLQSPAYQAVGILHDKDTDANGELKKEHWHFVVKFKNARTRTALADELEIPSNYIEPTASFEDSCRYLTHANAPDKFQYSDADLVGVLTSAAKKCIAFADECNAVLSILDYMNDAQRVVSMTELVRYSCTHGLWSDLRRGGALLATCLQEHNDMFTRRSSL